MKKIAVIIMVISSILIAISETSLFAGTNTELANRLFMVSAVGFGVGEVLFGLVDLFCVGSKK